MEVIVSSVFERDIDLFFIDEIISNKNFANFFFDKIKIENMDIVKVRHSLCDPNFGETDITIIVVDEKNIKHGILIEDKIDAIAMSNQCGRYFDRGNLGIKNGEYVDYKVCIIAPESYLDHNVEASKYDNKISYESILNFLVDNSSSQLKITLFQEAIYKKKIGYQVVENSDVTNFWGNYYKFQENYYPGLKITKQKGPRGANAVWPIFFTNFKRIKIYHKSSVGYVDLTFDGFGEKIVLIKEIIGNLLDDDMHVVKTSKSAAVRIKVPIIDFKQDFNDYKDELKDIFGAIEKLSNLVDKLDYYSIYKD